MQYKTFYKYILINTGIYIYIHTYILLSKNEINVFNRNKMHEIV